PLRSEFAKNTRSGRCARRNRSRTARNPTAGLTIACPKRMTSIRETHVRMSACARSRSARIASFQKPQSRCTSSARFAAGAPAGPGRVGAMHEGTWLEVLPYSSEQLPHDPPVAFGPGGGAALLRVAGREVMAAGPRRRVGEQGAVVVPARVVDVPPHHGGREP